MRNFFKNTLNGKESVTNRQIAELLDTDEDKVINQYKRYVSYIKKVKSNLFEKSNNFMAGRRSFQVR